MRIDSLDLLAYGPFTNRHLDLSAGSEGLHVIAGPNEAGKSSALRALRGLLFGIEVRTTDNFLHAHENLRIGGTLRRQGGQVLTIERRKGRKNTLLTPAGETLPEEVLAPFLSGVDGALFQTLFGIDHHSLVRGGEEILAQKGEVGETLFSAALGVAGLRSLLQELQKEAEDLFVPRATRRKIPLLIEEHNQCRQELQEVSFSSRAWQEARRELELMQKEQLQGEEEGRELERELTHLRRLEQAMPVLGDRRELREKLERCSAVVLLAADFTERRASASSRRETATERRDAAEADCQQLRQQRDEIVVHDTVLDHARTIEDWQQRLGTLQRDELEHDQLCALREELGREVTELEQGLRHGFEADRVEALRPVLDQRRGHLRALLLQDESLQEKIANAEEQERQAAADREEASTGQERHPAPPEQRALEEAWKDARAAGDLDEALRKIQASADALAATWEVEQQRLDLWQGTREELHILPLPPMASIDLFENRWLELEERRRRLEDEQRTLAEEFEGRQREAGSILKSGTVPREETLNEARERRDQGLDLLLRCLREKQDLTAESEALLGQGDVEQGYRASVSEADRLADQMRREARRLEQVESCEAALAQLARRQERLGQEQNAWDEDHRTYDLEWHELWAPLEVEPRSPREMRPWLLRCEALRERAGELDASLRERAQLEARHRGLCEALQAEFPPPENPAPRKDASLSRLCEQAEEVLANRDAARREHERWTQTLTQRTDDLHRAERKLQQSHAERRSWESNWSDLRRSWELPDGDFTPAQAEEFLEIAHELLGKRDRSQENERQIRDIKREAEAFAVEVGELVECAHPEIRNLPPRRAAQDLWDLLQSTRKRQARREDLADRLEQAEAAFHDATRDLQHSERQLADLCAEAQVKDAADLPDAERRSQERQQLERTVQEVERRLRGMAPDGSLDRLEEETRTLDLDELPGRCAELEGRLDETSQEVKELFGKRRAKEAELSRCHGGMQAAEVSQREQQVLAELRADVDRYVRLRLASHVLHQEIERYRREHQGPLLVRTGELFATLTRDSFARVRTDYDERDELVLIGERPSGEKVPITGMSSGTRDQLYLALKLATLERYLTTSEPLPFVVDDVLIHFDDARSAATLETLANLARQTQVILFTHHERVAEQARNLAHRADVHVHRLDDAAQAAQR